MVVPTPCGLRDLLAATTVSDLGLCEKLGFEQNKRIDTKKRVTTRVGHEPPRSSKNSHVVKIGNVNTTTMKCFSKLVTITMTIKALGQLICFTTETHRTGEETIDAWPEEAELDGWKFINSGFKRKAYGGVGIIMSPDVELVEYQVIDPGRILMAKLKYRGVNMLFHVIYGPTNDKW